MKSYPSILQINSNKLFIGAEFYTFEKLDGSNLRFEYSAKRGWYKFGTRTRLFDEKDEVFGCAIAVFNDTIKADVEKVIKEYNIQHLVIFAEFVGKNSFAGFHDVSDEKELFIIDCAVDKKGILEPAKFLKMFGNCKIAKYLGHFKWDKDFLNRVANSELGTFEGVVGKAKLQGNQLTMVKAKSDAWKLKVKEKFSLNAERILNS